MHIEIINIIGVFLVGYLALLVVVLLWRGKLKKKQKKQKSLDEKRFETEKAILAMATSNNTYPDLLQVFASLDEKLDKEKMRLEMDFRGYLSNENRE